MQSEHKRFDTGAQADLYSLRKDWMELWKDWATVEGDMFSVGNPFVERDGRFGASDC